MSRRVWLGNESGSAKVERLEMMAWGEGHVARINFAPSQSKLSRNHAGGVE